MIIETVRIKKDSPKGYCIINKADFVEGVHTVFAVEDSPAILPTVEDKKSVTMATPKKPASKKATQRG